MSAPNQPGTEPAPRWRRAPDVLWRSAPAAIVVLARHGDRPVVLGGSGADLWDLLDEPRTVGQLAAALSERYAAPPEVIAADLGGVIAGLAEQRVVQQLP